jgi:hypothetical protein
LSVEYCWWGRRKVLLTPSIETAAGPPRAVGAGIDEEGAVVVATVDKGR